MNRNIYRNFQICISVPLRVVYGDHKTKFSALLNIYKSVIYIKEIFNIYLLKSIKLKRVSRLQ